MYNLSEFICPMGLKIAIICLCLPFIYEEMGFRDRRTNLRTNVNGDQVTTEAILLKQMKLISLIPSQEGRMSAALHQTQNNLNFSAM